jgi:hypothetical protein
MSPPFSGSADDLDAVFARSLRRRTAQLCQERPAPAELIRLHRRTVCMWWRSTREYPLSIASAVALAESVTSVARCLPAHPGWDGIVVLARDLITADDADRLGAIHAVLIALHIPIDLTEWAEAKADWSGMVTECDGLGCSDVAVLLLRHLRWTLAILASGETPARERPPLVEAAFAGIAEVALTREQQGLEAWAILRHLPTVLYGQDEVARAAQLVAVMEDLLWLAEEAS